AELLGRGEGASLRDLLDPSALARTEAELQRTAPERRLRGAEGVADLLRLLGPLSTSEVAARVRVGADDEDPAPSDVAAGWLVGLETARRVIPVRIAGEERWAAVEDAGRLQDALGTPLPVGVAEAFTEPVADPLGDLLGRYARTHGPFTAAAAAARFGLGAAVVTEALRRLAASGRLVEGELRPLEAGGGQGTDWCDAEVLRTIRRRSLAALRAEVEPVPTRDLARFLPAWQGVGASVRGVDGLMRAVEQLAGAVVPASALETLILPARVPGYTPALLDELTATGEVVWSGHGALPGDDGWVALQPADLAPLTLPEPDAEFAPGELHGAVLDVLAGGGAYFFRPLSDAVGTRLGAQDDGDLAAALWDLTWAGLLTNDTLAPLRSRLGGGRTAHRARPSTPRARYAGRSSLRSSLRGAGRPAMPTRSGPPTAAGRWSLLPQRETDATVRAAAVAELLLERHGVVTRGAAVAERVPGGFAAAYRVLSAFEDAGRVRRGYFVEGLGASQFATPGAV
ncbi:MAG TPA: DEAD/DEAH box helicase, partial [Kineosporiaceae bacterium]|nr:DEAD/DEAH box helicase [Kineosporiaceae bacterium]